uniref:Retrovirus-related Pol polyprotein from transposon TNT 1-94-like beta-barrel domain-containing protein n=1 Tax=Fagus sylvatica TaxID=28930 RepID=A0A2N9FWX5_FAGSY
MVSKPRSPTMESSTTPVAAASNQSPLSLLNNMSNLMSTKLDSTNYMIWKLQISAILDAYSALAPLKKSGTNLKKGLPALHEPMCSISSWKLQSIKKGNESVNSYLQRIKTVRDKLSAVGVHSDHEELLHVILKGYPKNTQRTGCLAYAPFASAIRTRDGILSLEKLLVLLQTEEQSMQETNDPFSNSALAMFVSHNKPSNGYNANHSYNNSRGRGRNSFSRGRGGRSPERPTCQICWKQGHYAIDCYHRMDFAYQGKNAPTKLAAMASASNIQHTQNAETWLTDSGASDHITASSNNLSPQAPYQGQEQVSVGNGQNLPIQNIGNSQLHTKFHKFQLRNVLHVPRIASNLLSVHKLCLHNHCSCYFDANKLLIQDLPTGRVLYKGLSKNGVYPIQSSTLFNSVINKTACTAHSVSFCTQMAVMAFQIRTP